MGPISAQTKAGFEAAVMRAPDAQRIREAATSARNGRSDALFDLAAALAHAAFAAPETARAVTAAFCAGWLDGGAMLAMPDAAAAQLSRPFWDTFWNLFADHGPSDALAITGRVVALGGTLDPSLTARSERVAAQHPKAADPAHRTIPPRLTLAQLQDLPRGSLGHDFWRLIVDNRFDLEVLDREALSLSALPPALRFLNTRILQMHDVWHLMGPFQTTALHEVAISAFQQAQFGHGYSAMFLAVVVSRLAFDGGAGAEIILDTIADASRHGAESPSFMAIPWEAEWHRPVAEIRARHGLVPFPARHPADIFERLRPAA
jgi:ubiquinone biosynthesis protein Coq4